ncbi:hypothetical protein [Micromonospora gifhornensis]|uniref:hypothetical protein n=1 Tax=Micromonospora gifhornensis TaxID=84594 RepID=UPI003D71E53C
MLTAYDDVRLEAAAGWVAETQAERLRAEQHQQAATAAKTSDKASHLTQTVRASVDLAAHRWDLVRVRGGT